MNNNYYNWCFALAGALLVLSMPETASATSDPGALSKVLCNVVSWFTGPVGAAIATLAIIVIGVGALLGKVSWGMAIIVALGVAIIFGAPTIVGALGGTTACTTGTVVTPP